MCRSGSRRISGLVLLGWRSWPLSSSESPARTSGLSNSSEPRVIAFAGWWLQRAGAQRHRASASA
eukprot:9944318-Lingulodinium_polyedra.AAC.1